MAEPSPVRAIRKQESFFKTGAPLRFDSKTGLLKRSKSRKKAKSSINGLCDKPLEKLPVSKDLPRLARAFEVYVPDNDKHDNNVFNVQSFKEVTDWKALTNHKYVPDPEDDPNEIPKHIVLYQLLQVMAQNLPKSDLDKSFPSYEKYEQTVNLNDPLTLNTFLLEQFGEEHEVIRLLKVCHQSVIINILLGARHALTKHHIQFKDVRGAWRIQVHMPAKKQEEKKVSDEDTEDTESDPYLLDLERLKSKYISLAHRRREQVFITFAEWKKHMEEINGEPLTPTKGQSAIKQLFQFEWEVRIFFDPETLQMVDVTVQLLGIDYENEDGTITFASDCEKQKNALIEYFQQYVIQDEDDDDDEEEETKSQTVTNASPNAGSQMPEPIPPASPVPNERTALRANSVSRPLGITNLLFRLFCWRRRV
jgi:hypothetical protein